MKPKKNSEQKIGLPLIPNAGVEEALRLEIMRLVRPMICDFKAALKDDESDRAMDASIKDKFAKLSRTWNVRFEEAANAIASRFAVKVNHVSSRNVAMSLKAIGLKPESKEDQLWLADLREIAQESAELITNISKEYTDKIAQAVVESVAGELPEGLASRISELGAIAGRRAKNISRDQNAKAYSTLNAKKMMRAGVKRYIWRHSSAGKKPRPSHVAANGDIYEYGDPNVPKGATSSADIGMPGMCINCRCYAVPIVDEDLP